MTIKISSLQIESQSLLDLCIERIADDINILNFDSHDYNPEEQSSQSGHNMRTKIEKKSQQINNDKTKDLTIKLLPSELGDILFERVCYHTEMTCISELEIRNHEREYDNKVLDVYGRGDIPIRRLNLDRFYVNVSHPDKVLNLLRQHANEIEELSLGRSLIRGHRPNQTNPIPTPFFDVNHFRARWLCRQLLKERIKFRRLKSFACDDLAYFADFIIKTHFDHNNLAYGLGLDPLALPDSLTQEKHDYVSIYVKNAHLLDADVLPIFCTDFRISHYLGPENESQLEITDTLVSRYYTHLKSRTYVATTKLSNDEQQRSFITELMPNLSQLHIDFTGFPQRLLALHPSSEPILAIKAENDEHYLVNCLIDPVKDTIKQLYLWNMLVAKDLYFIHTYAAQLTHLSLYNCTNLPNNIDAITECINLIYLDVSMEKLLNYEKPVNTLYNWTRAMTQLAILDVSNTNLTQNASQNDVQPKFNHLHPESDVAGLRGLDHRLNAINVFGCPISATATLPAKKIGNGHGEIELLNALHMLMAKPAVAIKVMNEIYSLYRFYQRNPQHPQLVEFHRAFELVLHVMHRWRTDSSLQVSATASLAYITKLMDMTSVQRRRLVTALLDALELATSDSNDLLARNVGLILCQLDIAKDVYYCHKRLIAILVDILIRYKTDNISLRLSIYLLNSIACVIDSQAKSVCGDLNTIAVVCERIRERINEQTCDEFMSVAWSFLWNVTDETPLNCHRFVLADGLKHFEEGYHQFHSENPEFVRNMMGLMGNIAEVPDLREKLMGYNLLQIYLNLLDKADDGIEISYNSAGVLAHLCVPGKQRWHDIIDTFMDHEMQRHGIVEDVNPLDWESVQNRIQAATQMWPLNARRFINYRSFKPILALAHRYRESPASAHWAVWALANLTSEHPQDRQVDMSMQPGEAKYRMFIYKEGGIPILQKIICDGVNTSAKLRELANVAMENTRNWMRDNCVNMPQ